MRYVSPARYISFRDVIRRLRRRAPCTVLLVAAEADAVRCEIVVDDRNGERDGKHGAATTVETSDIVGASGDGPTG